MTIWMWGTMHFKKPVPKELQKGITEKYGSKFIFYEDGAELELDYTAGDYGDDINEIAHFLEKQGYAIDPETSSFPYTGDYEGGYLWTDGNFESYDQAEFILRTLPTEYLIDELNRRNSHGNPKQN